MRKSSIPAFLSWMAKPSPPNPAPMINTRSGADDRESLCIVVLPKTRARRADRCDSTASTGGKDSVRCLHHSIVVPPYSTTGQSDISSPQPMLQIGSPKKQHLLAVMALQSRWRNHPTVSLCNDRAPSVFARSVYVTEQPRNLEPSAERSFCLAWKLPPS